MAQTLPRTMLKPTVYLNYLKAIRSSNRCFPVTSPYFFTSFHSKQDHVKVKSVALWKRLRGTSKKLLCLCLSCCTLGASSLLTEGVSMRKGGKRDGRYLPTLPACLPLGTTAPAGCLSPALECEQSRTSVDESGNRHREVLSKS